MNYIAIFNDEYLEHHGVKGMKWGVRKSRQSGNRRRRRKDPRYMTEDELQSGIKRYKMEQDYYKARKAARNPVRNEMSDSARDITKSIIKTTGTAAAGMMGASLAVYLATKSGLPVKGMAQDVAKAAINSKRWKETP